MPGPLPEQSPEVVAAANLSPLSPSPVSIPNAAVSALLDQAATADAAAASTTTTPPPAPAQPPAMPSNPETAEISDTIVVAGDYSDESHEESDDSIDYGEGEEGQEQEKKVEPDAANDDYAKTFDSPAAHEDHQSEADNAQPDVSMASESMNSSSAPDPLTSQQPPAATAAPAAASAAAAAAAAPSDHHPSSPPAPGLAHANGSAQGTSAPSAQADLSESPSASQPPPSAAPYASPSSAPPATAAPADQAPAAPAPDAAPADAAAPAPASADKDDAAVDIQKLVDDITARAASTASPTNAPTDAPSNAPSSAPSNASSNASSSASPSAPTQATPSTTAPAVSAPSAVSLPPSLPPKPSVPLPPANLPALPQSHHPFPSRGPNAAATTAVPMNVASTGALHGPYTSAAASGAASDGVSSLPPPPPSAFGATSHSHAHLQSAHHIPGSGDASSGNFHAPSVKQLWEQFQADEKRYTSEAKWERFPEGSRIFIGNLSSERVTKREVFDVFHKFGRLAQISLKNAYGFVQYHTVAEGQAAMQGAQGIELGGRRIHLEVSRTQKKKDDRDRSPDRRNPRGGRGNDRYDTGDRGWRRDDYRPGRSPSPRRNDFRGRDGPYSRDRDFGGHERRRSRSPMRYGRYGDDSYRRRSPSPLRRGPPDGDRLDLPRRFGSDVPDVQILLLQEVSRDFVSWVQGAFHNRGLKTDVIYLNPRFPRDAVVQRQVVEGVHAIVDLDYAAQSQGKIPIQVFIRSGASSVRFELYQGIDPPVAAELVLREKSQSGAHLAQSRPPYAPPHYGQPYATEAPPAGYPYPYPQHSAPPPQPQPAAPAADLASVVGQLDNSALQALLASLQNPQAGGHAHAGAPPAGAPQTAPIDVNALLNNLRSTAAAQPAPVPSVPAYGAAPTYVPPVGGGAAGTPAAVPAAHPGMPGLGGADTAQQVQTIIDQLKRAAQ